MNDGVAELLGWIARHLVDDPDAVRVEAIDDDGVTVIRLEVAEDDVGKVIGRGGRIARSLRAIVRTSAGRSGHPIVLEIVD